MRENKIKVLIIDDEEIVRRALQRAFLLRGHQVFEAADGQQGIQVWNQVKPDLVFLDVVMPGISGPQVLRSIKDRGSTKVILMSAYADDKLAVLSESEYDLFISKPFEDIFDTMDRSIKIVGKDENHCG